MGSMNKIVRLRDAETKYQIALNHFNYAEGDYIDVAISELNEALLNLNRVRKELNLKSVEL